MSSVVKLTRSCAEPKTKLLFQLDIKSKIWIRVFEQKESIDMIGNTHKVFQDTNFILEHDGPPQNNF